MRLSTFLGALAAAAAFAGAAHAATWSLAVGEQARPPAGTPKGAALNQFMPGKLVVNAGDKVTFSSATFHTVTYLGNSKPQGIFMPDPTHGIYGSDLADSAGTPFYFDGLPKIIYNGLALGPAGGKTISGKAYTSSGILSPNGPKQKFVTATYTFPATGTYRLVCNLHPGMKVDVVVKPAGAPVAVSPAQVKAQILSDQSAGWAKAKQVATAAKPPAQTVYEGVGTASAILGYFPKVLTVKAGTTVHFVNRSPSEVHDLAFGPKKWIQAFMKKTDLFPMGPKSPNQASPVFPYGTEPKGKYSYDGTNHGNGFFVTPLTAGSPHVPLPHASTVTFTKAGTFKYFCLIHGPDMSGTVTVTP